MFQYIHSLSKRLISTETAHPTKILAIERFMPGQSHVPLLICDLLVQMLGKAERNRLVTLLKVARRAPAISHLLYADENMFYCKGTDEELDHLNHILSNYSQVSG